MKEKGYNYLKKITAVDYTTHLEAVYIIYNLKTKDEQTITVKIENEDASLPSVIKIYPAADWYERELQEMFDIKIRGRKMRRLLIEKWNGADAPLRKSFEWGKEYKKINGVK